MRKTLQNRICSTIFALVAEVYVPVIKSFKIVSLFILLTVTGKAQITIDSLSYEISMYGDVILHWTIPQGTIISEYKIYRGTDYDNMKVIAEIPYPTVRQYMDHNSKVIPGTTYIYGLKAVDIQGKVARKNIEVPVTPPPDALNFVSVPPTTALVGTDYWYIPLKVDATRQEDVEYSFSGSHPDGMQLISVSGGIYSYIYWRPSKSGQYKVTLVAKHKKTNAIAVQEFYIRVASHPGYVRGFVHNVEGKPLPYTLVRVFQVKNDMSYETLSDSLGNFFISQVEAGEVFAYAKSSSDSYVPQWYPLGREINDVSPRTLKRPVEIIRSDEPPAGMSDRYTIYDTLVYEFYLLTSPDHSTNVAGTVTNASTGLAVEGATISFIRKNNFINIGDTTIRRDPVSRENFSIDTSVTTDATGRFAVQLLVGKDYYVEVQHPSYHNSFNMDRPNVTLTNALDARPFRVADGMLYLSCLLLPVEAETQNRIVGNVRNASNGIDKMAVVVAVSPDLKRGAGGGHTYRTYRSTISDRNGYYSFENMPDGSTFSILALPLEKGFVPQYFSTSGGTAFAEMSEVINPNGTVQDINFELSQVCPGGIGTIFGQVLLQTARGIEPSSATLVFALSSVSRAVIGYAVTDSSGWYSITGLPKDNYILMAQNLSDGSAQSPVTELDYTSFNLFTATKLVNLTIDARPSVVDRTNVPETVTLYQNYPNPFNPSTSIRFAIPTRANVTLRVLDAMGRQAAVLAEGEMEAGTHTVSFDASALSAGIYYYQLQCGGKVLNRSMLFIK
jgi:hypothetical protein